MNKIQKILVIIVIALVFVSGCNTIKNSDSPKKTCSSDSDCVPEQCCHPTSCVLAEDKEPCGKALCTMDCRAGTLDCGQGSCRCIDRECVAEIDG